MKASKLILAVFFAVALSSSLFGKTSRIMADRMREDYITSLDSIINYKDGELEQSIPYTINPFFFDQPLLLKLKAPGGISDEDVLRSFRDVIISEVSGAFVRGNKRYLLMKSGELLKEEDRVTRKLPDLGDLEASVVIGPIQKDMFVLILNGSEFNVILSER